MTDQHPMAGGAVSGARLEGSASSAASINRARRPFWRKLLRGLAFLPFGIIPLAVLTALAGPIGAGIGMLVLLGSFIRGFTGEPAFGGSTATAAPAASPPTMLPTAPPPPLSSTASAPASAAKVTALAHGRRRGLWWKVPVGSVALLFGVATIAAIKEVHEKREGVGTEPTVPAKASGEVAAVAVTPRQPAAPPSPPRPQTLEDRVGAANVTRAGNFLLVRTKIGTVLSPKWVVIEAAQRLMAIGKWASANVAERTPGTKIALQVYAGVTDQNGRQSEDLILILAIAPSEFAQIDWGLFTPEQMLNLVEIEQLWPAARKAALEYCQDQGRAPFAPRFCAQAARFVR